MPDHSVHVVREIQRRSVGRHFNHVSLRADRVDAVFEHIITNLVQQVAVGVRRFKQLTKKLDLLIEGRLRHATFLVTPVCRHTQFGVPMHVVGTNLYLDRLALWSDDCRMQRLVIVLFRIGNIVVKFARNVRP